MRPRFLIHFSKAIVFYIVIVLHLLLSKLGDKPFALCETHALQDDRKLTIEGFLASKEPLLLSHMQLNCKSFQDNICELITSVFARKITDV